MKLPPEAIQEFREIYLAEFGEEISEQEAEAQGQSVFTFLQTIFNKK